MRFLAVTQPVDHLLEVELADRVVGPDGADSALVPSVAAALWERYGHDWTDICDAKPYVLVAGVLDAARDAWGIGDAHRRVLTRAMPESTGHVRLDRLVAGVRLAGGGTVVQVGGVTCVEHRLPDGMVVTTPIDPGVLERLRAAVPGMVG